MALRLKKRLGDSQYLRNFLSSQLDCWFIGVICCKILSEVEKLSGLLKRQLPSYFPFTSELSSRTLSTGPMKQPWIGVRHCYAKNSSPKTGQIKYTKIVLFVLNYRWFWECHLHEFLFPFKLSVNKCRILQFSAHTAVLQLSITRYP